MKKLFFFIAISTIVSVNIKAQNSVFIKSGVGINNVYLINSRNILNDIKHIPGISLNLGISDKYKINNTKSVNVDLDVSYQPVKEKLFTDSLLFIDAISPYYEYYENGYRVTTTHNFYIQIPMYISFRENKNMGVDLGLRNNFLINKKYSNQSFYNLSMSLGLNYKINNRFILSLNFYTDIIPYINNNNINLFNSFEFNNYNYGTMLSLKYKLF